MLTNVPRTQRQLGKENNYTAQQAQSCVPDPAEHVCTEMSKTVTSLIEFTF